MAWLAKDGKPFDVVNIFREAFPTEVEVIQFLRPDGKRRRMLVEVGKEHADMAANLVLSCEELRTGEIVVYARHVTEDDEKEVSAIAINGPGPCSPTEMLKKVIAQKAQAKEH